MPHEQKPCTDGCAPRRTARNLPMNPGILPSANQQDPASPVVLTAEKSCTTAPCRTLKNGRIILSAPPPARREKTCAKRISSLRVFWKRVYGSVCKSCFGISPIVKTCSVIRMYVCAPDKSSGHRMQDVNISLACIGFLPKSILSEMVNHAAKSRTA